ncbi:MAG: DUF5691 domain-containing protein [Pseudomonadota bacterium]
MRDIAEDLAQIKGRWMIGGAALDRAPAAWQAVAGGDDEAELALLAIVGQATQLLYRPEPVDAQPAKRLPRLSLPPLPDDLRPTFRRLLALIKPSGEEMTQILWLMASRGATVHPADWMPKAVDELPDVYAPWSDWRDRAAGDPPEMLTSETWEEWMPAERRLALTAMRRDDPAQALALIIAHAPGLAAEQRFRTIQCLGVGLGPADADFLRGLETDRSAKVRRLATQLLSQLGLIEDDGASAAELAGFFAIQAAGVFQRRQVLVPTKLKTEAQRARRRELFTTVSLSGFAAALALSPADLVGMWSDKDPETIPDIAGMIARTGPADLLGPALDRLLEFKDTKAEMLTELIQRVPPEDRHGYIPRLLQHDLLHLATSVTAMRDHLGSIDRETLRLSGVLKEVTRAVESYVQEEHRNTDTALRPMLTNLGFLVDAPTARALLDLFVSKGAISADPALAMLSFNAALTGEIP